MDTQRFYAQSRNQSQNLSLLTSFHCFLLLCLIFFSFRSLSFTLNPNSTPVRNLKPLHVMEHQTCINFSPQLQTLNPADLQFPCQSSITDLGTSQHPAQAVQKCTNPSSIICSEDLSQQTLNPFNQWIHPYRIFNLSNARRKVALQLYI